MSERKSHVCIWGKYKCPVADIQKICAKALRQKWYLLCLRNSKEASVAGIEGAMPRTVEGEVRG